MKQITTIAIILLTINLSAQDVWLEYKDTMTTIERVELQDTTITKERHHIQTVLVKVPEGIIREIEPIIEFESNKKCNKK